MKSAVFSKQEHLLVMARVLDAHIRWSVLYSPNTCSDITNTQVGISGETVPKGGNLCIYCVHNGVVLIGVSHHTILLPW